jgi:hypothetical protein
MPIDFLTVSRHWKVGKPAVVTLSVDNATFVKFGAAFNSPVSALYSFTAAKAEVVFK